MRKSIFFLVTLDGVSVVQLSCDNTEHFQVWKLTQGLGWVPTHTTGLLAMSFNSLYTPISWRTGLTAISSKPQPLQPMDNIASVPDLDFSLAKLSRYAS